MDPEFSSISTQGPKMGHNQEEGIGVKRFTNDWEYPKGLPRVSEGIAWGVEGDYLGMPVLLKYCRTENMWGWRICGDFLDIIYILPPKMST